MRHCDISLWPTLIIAPLGHPENEVCEGEICEKWPIRHEFSEAFSIAFGERGMSRDEIINRTHG
jgi:hypothetical protein